MTREIRRKLFIHAAHNTVGLSSGNVVKGPYCRWEQVLELCDPPAADQLKIALLIEKHKHRSNSTIASIEKIVVDGCRAHCKTIELARIAEQYELLAGSDGFIALGNGICIARHYDDLQPFILPEGNNDREEHAFLQLEVFEASIWHPILAGVGPFIGGGRGYYSRGLYQIPATAEILITGRTCPESISEPLAWAYRGHYGRVFFTSLMPENELLQAGLSALLVNAIKWVTER